MLIRSQADRHPINDGQRFHTNEPLPVFICSKSNHLFNIMDIFVADYKIKKLCY